MVSLFFFFKQKTAYEMRISDWSSDVCSSDLKPAGRRRYGQRDGHKSGQPPPGFFHIGKLTLCARAGLLFWFSRCHKGNNLSPACKLRFGPASSDRKSVV